MEIKKLDHNFAEENAQGGGMKYYNIPEEPFDLYGVYFCEKEQKFVRMDGDVARSVSQYVGGLYANTAGGRIRFSTDSDIIELKVTYDELHAMSHMPLTCSCGFMLIDETEREPAYVYAFRPSNNGKNANGFSDATKIKTRKGMRKYILYMPLYNNVTSLTIGVAENAAVDHGRNYRVFDPILYYGSSITQGGCASRPDNCYQAIIESHTNIDFINLGFSNGARAEEAMVDYLASIDTSLFVCDYDHNEVDYKEVRRKHYALYKRYREKRPDTPILFLTKPDFERIIDGDNNIDRVDIITATYDRARAAGDKNVYMIDGREFFAGYDKYRCAVDYSHPNDFGFFRMAEVIEKKIREILDI